MIVNDNEGLRRILEDNRSLAVVGMKPPDGGPAWSVPAYMRQHGYSTIAVNPKYDEVGGIPSVRSISDLPDPVDMIVIFRRPEFIPALADEILALETRPRVVWMQLGIREENAAKKLSDAGIDVVQDRCLYIDHPRLLGRNG